MSMPFIERMVRVSNVAWSRNPDGTYWVTWDEDGVREVRTFKTAHAAEQFARWLDTTEGQPTAKDIRAAEKSLRELEEEVYELDRPEREALRELGVPMATLRERRRSERALERLERPIRVRRYRRFFRS